MVLAGILAAQPLTGKALTEHTIMVAGEGAAGTALAELLAEAIARATMRCAAFPLVALATPGRPGFAQAFSSAALARADLQINAVLDRAVMCSATAAGGRAHHCMATTTHWSSHDENQPACMMVQPSALSADERDG